MLVPLIFVNRRKLVFWSTIEGEDVRRRFKVKRVEKRPSCTIYYFDIPVGSRLRKTTIKQRKVISIEDYEVDHNGFLVFRERIK